MADEFVFPASNMNLFCCPTILFLTSLMETQVQRAPYIDRHVTTSQRKQKSFDCLQRQAGPAKIQWRSRTVMMTATWPKPSRSKVVRWPWSVMSVTMGSIPSMIASHSA
jgi:hypothetical protein